MLVIELEFPGGRFHATPWGRHVNEGVPEWPPSPYRLARALVDVWARRHADWEQARVEAVLAVLAGEPRFALPPAATGHTRSYLSENAREIAKKSLVFDAFVAVHRDARLQMAFDTDPGDSVRRDLAALLADLPYLGRSESWTRARLLEDGGGDGLRWSCVPAGDEEAPCGGDPVSLACLRSAADYERLACRPRRQRGGGRRRSAGETPHLSWFEALCLTTKELQKGGWNGPPALRSVDYVRRADALAVRPFGATPGPAPAYREVHYALVATVLPLVTETVSLAERVRAKLMGLHRRLMGGDPSRVSPSFSGKAADGSFLEGHRHMWVLPLDRDGDGRIDTLIVRLRAPFSRDELAALDRLESLWQSDGRPDVRLVLTSMRRQTGHEVARRWVSATPFVTRRHHRRGRGPHDEWIAGELRRECRLHGLPEPTAIRASAATLDAAHPVPWFAFQRGRKGRRPMRGHGFALNFGEPVRGPLALGAGGHFGLGAFVPRGDAGEE